MDTSDILVLYEIERSKSAATSDQTSTIRPQAMRKMLIPVQVAVRSEAAGRRAGRSGSRSPCSARPRGRPAPGMVEPVAQVGEGAEEVGHHRGHAGHVHGVGVAARGMVDELGGEELLQGVGVAPVDHLLVPGSGQGDVLGLGRGRAVRTPAACAAARPAAPVANAKTTDTRMQRRMSTSPSNRRALLCGKRNLPRSVRARKLGISGRPPTASRRCARRASGPPRSSFLISTRRR